MSRQSGISDDEREFWLRRAVEDGDLWAMTSLAELAEKRKRPEDAEHWYRMAIAHGVSSRRTDLAHLLMRQGRLSEAEECVRPKAEAGSVRGAGQLAEVLEQLGRRQEPPHGGRRTRLCAPGRSRRAPTSWIAPHRSSPRSPSPRWSRPPLCPSSRDLSPRLPRTPTGRPGASSAGCCAGTGAGPAVEAVEESTGEEEPGLLIADDAEAGITLFVWSNASDEALRALSSLDMDELAVRRPDQGRVRLVWHPATGRWRIRGE
ncbi:tetratricopeptide repeat protein [Streptomyces sp. INA 01156]